MIQAFKISHTLYSMKRLTKGDRSTVSKNLERSAMLAKRAYEDPDPDSMENMHDDCEGDSDSNKIFIDDEESGGQAYVLFGSKTAHIYIVFRGTEEAKDVAADLNTMHADFEGTRVHAGFCKQFKALAEKISSALCEIDAANKISSLYFIGHSLGGALATLGAVHYRTVYPDARIVCHTFGCPRVGNTAFTQLFSRCVDENVRVYNKNDPVPMIPCLIGIDMLMKRYA